MRVKKEFDKKNILKRQAEIDELIESTFIDESPINDGIINIEEYVASEIKILWVLKEINDIEGYDHRQATNETAQRSIDNNSFENLNRKNWWRTLDPVIYISYMIHSQFLEWSDPRLSYIRDSPSMTGILQKIAFINIKKTPGGSTSIATELEEGYIKGKEIIKQQIDLINPDVVIGGNTLDYLSEDFNLEPFISLPDVYIKYRILNNRLYINSYHPNFFSRNNEDMKEVYFNSIVDLVKKWSDESLE